MKHFAEEAIQLIDIDKEPGVPGVRMLVFDVSRLPNEVVFELGRLLTPAELHRASRFRSASHRRVYLSSWGMLRKIATDVLGSSSSGLLIEEGKFGKPYFKGHRSELPFSISKSGEVVAIAVDFAGREVGIDIEMINSRFEYWEVAGYYFSKQECDRIFNHRDYFRLKTMKEALLKCTGVGVVEDATRIDLSQPVNRMQVMDERLLPFKSKGFSLFTFDNGEAVFTLALSVSGFQGIEMEGVKVSTAYFM